MARYRTPALRLSFLSLIIAAIAFSGLRITPASQASPAQSTFDSKWTPANEYGFVYSIVNGEVVCRPTDASESPFLFEENPDLELHDISRGQLTPQAGSDITFILRGTEQLEANPQAKAVFLRAAEAWRQQLKSAVPITIIIDVDFGATLFGQPFGENVIGGTLSQQLTGSDGYLDVLNALKEGAETAEDINLYDLLPAANLPTNKGATQGITMPSALLRALGIISPVADPILETPNFGNPPRIGFNSDFDFDFDASNGIAPDTIDFEAVATHEIGHLLGFTSMVGITELNPNASVTASGIDIFRFRPGTTAGTFTSAQRIVSSGGQHVFFAGGNELQLSTGRPNGEKGDKRQASHWKDDSFTGLKIGIMDPTIAFGEHVVIGANDLLALDTMGFRLRDNPNGKPFLRAATGNLVGNVLVITGTVVDTQGDISQLQITLLNSAGSILQQNAPVPVNLGTADTINFNVNVNNLGNFPTATQAQIAFIDQAGNTSNALTVDFGKADAGGPNLKKVTLNINNSTISIKGSGLRGQVQVEVNGVIPIGGASDNNKKLTLSTTALNLQQGPNRFRLIINNLRSNIVIVNR